MMADHSPLSSAPPSVSQVRDDKWLHSQPSPEKLSALLTREPSTINTVAEDEWVELEVAVDSGATETVMAEETLSGVIDITEGAA